MDKTKRGAPIPNPKNKKFKRLMKKLAVVVFKNKAAIKAGLHGITIAPKKNPNRKAFFKGFLDVGVLNLGKNFPKSKLKIKNKLITANKVNAIGDITPITFVNETCKIKENTNPNSNINNIKPETTINPNKTTFFLDSFPVNLFDK